MDGEVVDYEQADGSLPYRRVSALGSLEKCSEVCVPGGDLTLEVGLLDQVIHGYMRLTFVLAGIALEAANEGDA